MDKTYLWFYFIDFSDLKGGVCQRGVCPCGVTQKVCVKGGGREGSLLSLSSILLT